MNEQVGPRGNKQLYNRVNKLGCGGGRSYLLLFDE
jgi:hypothetical protein